MFNYFLNIFKKNNKNNQSLDKLNKISEILYPDLFLQKSDGYNICIDYSVDANLEAAFQDIIDNNISKETKNSLKFVLQRLVEAREILKKEKKYPSNFEYYVIKANPIDLSLSIDPEKEKPIEKSGNILDTFYPGD